MIASMWTLSRSDAEALKITDGYSLHRIVYDLFDDIRTDEQKSASIPSGILYADKGGDFNTRRILILSNRLPKSTLYGIMESRKIPESLCAHEYYQFEVIINPTKRDSASGKTIAVRGREAIAEWFMRQASASWGFTVNLQLLRVEDIKVKKFNKKGHQVTLGSAKLIGELQVLDREKFTESCCKGIGRARAFGFGLLQVIPTS